MAKAMFRFFFVTKIQLVLSASKSIQQEPEQTLDRIFLPASSTILF